ncbi:hypothetical protein AGLY_001880 [Aphis glycines]|uniref:Uncharacterized protein n=1 Tax=Aphis glycines TaxID=307491 RepID=A0A6G0U6J3_APHGL|nr:hypothetical protein AGLY_001880 [Aphis glycines]
MEIIKDAMKMNRLIVKKMYTIFLVTHNSIIGINLFVTYVKSIKFVVNSKSIYQLSNLKVCKNASVFYFKVFLTTEIFDFSKNSKNQKNLKIEYKKDVKVTKMWFLSKVKKCNAKFFINVPSNNYKESWGYHYRKNFMGIFEIKTNNMVEDNSSENVKIIYTSVRDNDRSLLKR